MAFAICAEGHRGISMATGFVFFSLCCVPAIT